MSSERLYFVGGHGGLATFTRKVMSEKEKGSFFEEQKNVPARQCGARTPSCSTQRVVF